MELFITLLMVKQVQAEGQKRIRFIILQQASKFAK